MADRQPPPPGSTLEDAGEFGVIQHLVGGLARGANVLVGPGDDAALVSVPSGQVVVTTDVLVEGRHFRRDWAGAADIGRRAAAQSLSDVNAMGGRATAVTVGVAAPAELEVAWLAEFTDGLVEECASVGASLVGGDLTRSVVLTIAVTAIGEVAGAPVLRTGARAGDVVAMVGRQGWAAAGLAVLSRGFRSPRAVVEAYRRPEVRYDQGPAARAAGASAMVDVSDGLLADLGHLAVASGVAIDLDSGALPVPEPLVAVGAAVGADPLSFVLTGGDDHPLAATFPSGVALPEGWLRIGSVAALVAGEEPIVTVDGQPVEGPQGYTHF